MVVHFPHSVEGKVSADCHAESFNGVYLVPAFPSVPDFHQRVLYDVLCLCIVARDAQGKPVENILQGQDVVSEADLFHLVL